jgi:ADP-ribose pyrophosphatase YjhB (NUDIX family)
MTTKTPREQVPREARTHLADAIKVLDQHIPNPSMGLPDDVFFYVSRVTPLVNVDLLIKDEDGRTLLSWRDDQYAGKGWHVPGGIVRFKETLETRIKRVAKTEIGTNIGFDPVPIAIHQIIDAHHVNRGHFISLLYNCFLPNTFIPKNRGLSRKDNGYLMWHSNCPGNLIKAHRIYKKYLT